MARYTIEQFFKNLGSSITKSSYYTPGVALRFTIADTFGYPSDTSETGWKNYVSSGENNPTGKRAFSLPSYPYLIVGGLRSTLMKSIDWLSLGGKMLRDRKSRWWAVALKVLVAIPLYPAEILCYFIAKGTDKLVSYYSSKNEVTATKFVKIPPSPSNVAKTTRLSLIRRFINWITPKKTEKTKSTFAIEKKLSTVTHDVHNHGSKASVASNHPVFSHSHSNTYEQIKEYNDKTYETLKEKVSELKTDYHNTDQPDLNIAAKLKELANLINPANRETLPLRASRLEMIHKFHGGKSDSDSTYAHHFKLDWEKFQRLVITLEKDILKLKVSHKSSLDSDDNDQPHHEPSHH